MVLLAAALAACTVTPVAGDVLADGIFITAWCGVPRDQTLAWRYDQFKAAGFTVASPPCLGSARNNDVLNLCAQRGIKTMIADYRLLTSIDSSSFYSDLDAVVADYSAHSALWGYYLWDEPHASEFQQLAARMSYLRQKDPVHVPYINLFPIYAKPEQLGTETYEEYVDQFLEIVKPPLLSFDHYGQMTSYNPKGFFDNIEIIRDRALQHDIPFMVIFLVTAHGPYRNPSMADLRWQAFNSLAYGAWGLSYYTYWACPCGADGIIDSSGNTTEHYPRVQQLNAQVKALSPILSSLRSRAVYHVGDNIPSKSIPLPANELITSIQGANAVVGFFTNDQGARYAMLVNKDMLEDRDIEITFKHKVMLYEVSKTTGARVPIGLQQTFNLPFLAGEGRLFDFSDLQAPSVPTDVQADVQSPSRVHLSWTASTDDVEVVGYRIIRNGAVVATSATNSYTNTGLQPNTTYSYSVSAYDAAGNHSAESSPPIVVTTPFDTQPPSVPTNINALAYSMTAIQMTWTASTDDVAVAGYKVYRDDSQIGTNIWPNYNDTGLQPGTAYTYTVTAYDAAGNVSAHSVPTVVTTPSVPDFCSVDLSSTDVNYYLSRVNYTTDGSTSAVPAGGLNCRQPSNTSNQYFYFAIDDTYIYNGSVSTTYLEVCYFDDLSGGAFIEPQYDSTAGAYTSLPQVALTGTGKWKTASWTLNDCLFANRQNGGADFRLYVGPNLVKIDSVRISKSLFAEHVSVERNLGVNEVYGGLSHPQHADGNTMVQLKDGIYCKKPSAGNNYFFYFNVSDAVIYDSSSSTVYLKVGYYNSEGGLITPEYDSTSGEYTPAATLNFTGTNTWKEACWTLTDVKFANRQNANADFRLFVGTAQNVFIDTVVVSKMPFPDTEPPSAPSDLQAEGITPTAIRVTWTASTDNMGVAGYRIYRNGSLMETTAATDFTDTGLSPNTAYSYSISAFDASGNESGHSAVVGTTLAASSIASAKELADMSPVGMVSQTVTAVFNGYLYVGTVDPYSGIRVVPIEIPAGISVGSTVDIGGCMQTVDGERHIDGATVFLVED